MLCFKVHKMDHIIIESYHKGTILQWNYRKMTISWSSFSNSFVKNTMAKKVRATSWSCNIHICNITRCYKGTVLFFEISIGLKSITQAVENYKFDP